MGMMGHVLHDPGHLKMMELILEDEFNFLPHRIGAGKYRRSDILGNNQGSGSMQCRTWISMNQLKVENIEYRRIHIGEIVQRIYIRTDFHRCRHIENTNHTLNLRKILGHVRCIPGWCHCHGIGRILCGCYDQAVDPVRFFVITVKTHFIADIQENHHTACQAHAQSGDIDERVHPELPKIP